MRVKHPLPHHFKDLSQYIAIGKGQIFSPLSEYPVKSHPLRQVGIIYGQRITLIGVSSIENCSKSSPVPINWEFIFNPYFTLPIMSKCALLISPRATKDCDRFGSECKYEREIVPPLGFLIVIIILFSSSLRFSLLK